jgi:hypothetical protein
MAKSAGSAAGRGWCFVAVTCVLGTLPRVGHAFWVVNFGPAAPAQPGHLAFVGGMGGQVVFAGEPTRTSAVFFIPHAGLRVGLLDHLDVGFRLAPLPLPYGTVGPGLGGNIDVKVLVTPRAWRWHFALDAGAGLAHALVNDQGRVAWSPNAAALLSARLGERTWLTFMARYAYIGITSATGGESANHVHVVGGTAGLRLQLTERVALMPELGAFRYLGAIGGQEVNGVAGQYGIVLGASL